MRLIDADKLLERDKYDTMDRRIIAVSSILNAPTIDAVPVVRCKDCVYAKPFNAIWRLPKKDNLICTLNDGAEVAENDFCSFGRRKDDSN